MRTGNKSTTKTKKTQKSIESKKKGDHFTQMQTNSETFYPSFEGFRMNQSTSNRIILALINPTGNRDVTRNVGLKFNVAQFRPEPVIDSRTPVGDGHGMVLGFGPPRQ